MPKIAQKLAPTGSRSVLRGWPSESIPEVNSGRCQLLAHLPHFRGSAMRSFPHFRQAFGSFCAAYRPHLRGMWRGSALL